MDCMLVEPGAGLVVGWAGDDTADVVAAAVAVVAGVAIANRSHNSHRAHCALAGALVVAGEWTTGDCSRQLGPGHGPGCGPGRRGPSNCNLAELAGEGEGLAEGVAAVV